MAAGPAKAVANDWETVSGPSDWETVSSATPKPSPPGFAESAWNEIKHGPANLLATGNAILHPIDTLSSMGRGITDMAAKTGESFRAGNYGEGIRRGINTGLNAVIPGLGTSSEEAGEDLAKGNYASGLGKTAGIGVNTALMAKSPQIVEGAANAVIPVAKTALKVAASKPAATLIGAGIGNTVGHPIIGGIAGREMAGLARKGLNALETPEPTAAPIAPVSHRAGIQAPPLVTPAEGAAATPRPDWRQSIVDEMNKQPASAVAEPPNTITSPATAPEVDVHPKVAASRTALAQKMGQKLQEAGAPVEDVAKLADDDPFWQTLEQSIRPNGKATRSKPPSPDTVQLVREYHQQFAGKQAPIAKPMIPATLKGRSLDIAQKLKAEMGQ